MMASYLEQSVGIQSTDALPRDIVDIWKDINQDPKRPVTQQNAHAKWWLERHFPRLEFEYVHTLNEVRAIDTLIRFIDRGAPVMMSVSHARVPGHIVIVIGYENYEPNLSSADFKLVVHDPYGRFDPSLMSNLYGTNRTQGGRSLAAGGESGPGAGVRLPITSVARQRAGDAARGSYYMIAPRR